MCLTLNRASSPQVNKLTGQTRRKKDENATDNENEKRKRSVSKEEQGSGARRSTKKTKDGRVVDTFCWKCHKQGYDKICSTCPRVYHNTCLIKAGKFTEQDVCPECQLPSVDGTKPSEGLTADMMDKVLVCLIRRLLPATTSKSFGINTQSKGRFSKLNDKVPTKLPELMKWPQQKYKTCKPVDLGLLIEAIKNGGSYSRTVELFSDVQWIYHNSYKFFGAQSEITKAANKIVKAVKNELLDIEACYECYYRNYNEIEAYDCDPFSMICTDPHVLIWAKLKGHPFWPSKCLKVIDGKAQIQFFGTHDKNCVEANTCYLLSRNHPNPKYVGQKTYYSSITDLDFYTQNYARKYGPYCYAEDKVQFLPTDKWHWVKEKPQFQSPSPKRKHVRKSTHGKRATVNGETDHNTGGDSGMNIVISSIRGISNEDAFQDNCEPQTAPNSDQNESFCNYQTVGNSWSSYPWHIVSNSISYSPWVSLHRLDDSVTLQYQQKMNYQANPSIKFSTSQPVIANLQSCSGARGNVRKSVGTLEQSHEELSDQPACSSGLQSNVQSHPESFTLPTSCGRRQTLTNSERINDISGFSSNVNENSADEPFSARSANDFFGNEVESIKELLGLKGNIETTDPEICKMLLEGGRYIKQSSDQILQYFTSYANGHKIICSFLKKIKSIDSDIRDLEREKEELREKASEWFNPTYAQIIRGTRKMAEDKTAEKFNREKKRLDTEIKNLQNVLLFHNKEHSNYIRTLNKNLRSTKTNTDGLTKENCKKYEEKAILERIKLEQEYNDKILEIKSQVWCKRCLEVGKIYCCWNTYYCTEDCRIKHRAVHQPLCRDKKKLLSGHSVTIEEITDSEACEASTSTFPVPVIEED
ncbi:uncharacterized protein LOC129216368 [Uloborus diversus]|uniref:uncharacterized protein LOC129216368 n=1 Tax=Uloborus diversus TaxID=327109 RepID=UPI002409CB3C|nr:uncharacterized protein LOC129216368 [Uloborus diversus]